MPALPTDAGTSSRRGRKKKRRQGGAGEPKLSRQNKPENMSLEDWQRQLRRQFGREQAFAIKNLGAQPVFSEFQVTNPQSKNSYRVSIRGPQPGDNFCTC